MSQAAKKTRRRECDILEFYSCLNWHHHSAVVRPSFFTCFPQREARFSRVSPFLLSARHSSSTRSGDSLTGTRLFKCSSACDDKADGTDARAPGTITLLFWGFKQDRIDQSYCVQKATATHVTKIRNEFAKTVACNVFHYTESICRPKFRILLVEKDVTLRDHR